MTVVMLVPITIFCSDKHSERKLSSALRADDKKMIKDVISAIKIRTNETRKMFRISEITLVRENTAFTLLLLTSQTVARANH